MLMIGYMCQKKWDKLRRTKNADIKFKCARRLSGITFIRCPQNQKIGKSDNSNVFVSKTSEGPKHDGQNRLWSCVREDNLSFHNNYII